MQVDGPLRDLLKLARERDREQSAVLVLLEWKLRVHSFVKRQTNDIMLFYETVKETFHHTFCSNTRHNCSLEPMYSIKFNGFKEVDIILIKEHHIDGSLSLVDFMRIAC